MKECSEVIYDLHNEYSFICFLKKYLAAFIEYCAVYSKKKANMPLIWNT